MSFCMSGVAQQLWGGCQRPKNSPPRICGQPPQRCAWPLSAGSPAAPSFPRPSWPCSQWPSCLCVREQNSQMMLEISGWQTACCLPEDTAELVNLWYILLRWKGFLTWKRDNLDCWDVNALSDRATLTVNYLTPGSAAQRLCLYPLHKGVQTQPLPPAPCSQREELRRLSVRYS